MTNYEQIIEKCSLRNSCKQKNGDEVAQITEDGKCMGYEYDDSDELVFKCANCIALKKDI